MTLTLYGKPASRTFRVLWAVEETDLRYENIPYDFSGPEIKAPAFRAINPNAAIPALTDDGRPLFESLAINLYLARKAQRLWPSTVYGEGLVYQWTLWAATEVEPVIGRWFYNAHALPEAERKPEVAKEAADALPRKLDVLESRLAASPWLADDDFSIADLNVAAVLFRAPQFGLARWPAVAKWHGRCYERPAARRAVALRESPPR
ncbi:MAG TPA: glutathione S-transferase family protein [Casimicrobiaceae bacterium]|nr:glutathione S-transferase family protein [Casimicrobiaceae bacterium]